MKKRGLVWLVGVCLLVAAPLAAQTFRGSIVGVVSDASGAVVLDARVTIKNLGTGVQRTASTDDTGYFVAAELPIGNYSVTVEKEGFQTAVASGVRVDVAGERRVDITLEPGAMEQRTEVTAAQPLVDTTTNVMGGTLETRMVEELPINGRDFSKLLVLVPGASGDPVGNTDFPGSFGLFSTNGNRGRANNYLLDGTDMNDGYRNLPALNQGGVFGTPGSILSLDALAEVRIISNFEPEYGRNGGSVVNIVTKSGTNDLHGTIYEFFRNDRLNARNFFNNVGLKDKFRNNNFGFTLGGPLRRDSTFFFFGYEGQRERGAVTTLAAVPTAADFAAALAAIGGAVNPVTQNLLNLCASTGECSGGNRLWPTPTPGREGLTLNAVVQSPYRNTLDSFIAKIDHNFKQKNLISGRYFFSDSDQSFPLGLAGGNNLPRTNTFSPIRVQLLSLSWVRVDSPTRVNELRIGWNRYHQDFLADDRQVFGNPAVSLGMNTGVTNPRDFGLPLLRVRPFANLGSSIFSNPRGRVDTNWHIIDNYSIKKGRHDLKFGYEFRRTFVNSFNDSSFRGRITFDSLADFLAGNISFGHVVAGGTDRGTFQNSWAGYIQDSVRVSSRLTFNWGLRYDYYGVLDEERDRFSRYDPSVGLIPLGTPGFPRLYDRDWNNFGPRLSFAWDPTGSGKTVIRAGWGLFYDAFSQDFFIGQIPWNTFSVGAAYNPIGETPVFISFVTTPTLAPGAPVFPGGFLSNSTDITEADPNLRTPYVQNYNLNIQRELWTNTVLQVSYVGSLGRKLFRTREINQSPVPGGARPFDSTAPLGGQTLAGTQPFIVNQVETSATSNYNSLQVSFNQRNWHGWTHSVNWTWGHSIDTASDGIESLPNQATPDNSNNPAGERANSNFDTRHRFVWTWIYDVPKLGDASPKLTEGWHLSGILTLMTGFPFGLNMVGFDDSGAYDFVLRPDLVGDPFLGRREPDRYLNLSALAVPCTLASGATSASGCIPGTLHYGSLPRNFFTGPDYKNFDFSIIKNTPINERVTIQFRADFYNFTNHSNFASPTLPAFIAEADLQGIHPGGTPLAGRGGANGVGCTTTGADPNCFFPIQATPDTGIGYTSLGGGAPRNVQFVLKVIF